MHPKPLMALILSAGLLAACSSGSEADNPAASARDKALLEATQKPLEQARQVERQVLEAADAERKKIEEEAR